MGQIAVVRKQPNKAWVFVNCSRAAVYIRRGAFRSPDDIIPVIPC